MTKKLYHISKSNKIKSMSPSIPNNFFTKNGYEENKTKRISFSPSIDGCILGVNVKEGDEYFVYELLDINNKFLKQPSKKEVPDVKLTKEIWYLSNCKVRLVGKIKIGKPKGPDLYFKYGNNTAITGLWHYKWVEKYNKDIIEYMSKF